MPPTTRSATRVEEAPAPKKASAPKKVPVLKKAAVPGGAAAPKKTPAVKKAPATKKTGKGAVPRGSSKPAPKGKGTAARGVQKPAPTSRAKKSTTGETMAKIAAMDPVPFPHTPLKYFELEPPDLTPDEDGEIPNGGYVGRHIKKAKKDHNGSEVKISEGGYKRLAKMYVECDKRDPDNNGYIHIFEDFRGYGIIEVIGAQIADYVKEQKKASPDIFKSFEIIEALSFFFDGTYDDAWTHVDDGDGVEDLVKLIGVMIVDCFHRMEFAQRPLAPLLSKPELTPIKNAELVMGLCLGFGSILRGIMGDGPSPWEKEIWKIAERRVLELRDTKGRMEKEPSVDEDDEDDEIFSDDEEDGEVNRFNFAKTLAAYTPRGFRLGGTHYDLSRDPPPVNGRGAANYRWGMGLDSD